MHSVKKASRSRRNSGRLPLSSRPFGPGGSCAVGMSAKPQAAMLLLTADRRLQHVLEPVLDLLVRLLDVLVGERAVERLVGEGVGQALLARRHALAVVDVEQPHSL